MLSMILMACLMNDPSVCKEYKVPLSEAMDANQCAMYAPPFVAQWAGEHPGLLVTRWSCRPTAEDNI